MIDKLIPYCLIKSSIKITILVVLALNLTNCSQKSEADLNIIGCINQEGEILSGIAEVRINGVLHEIDCSAKQTITYKIASDRIPLQFSGGQMPGYVLISPSETLPMGLSGLEVELAFRSTANMLEIVINSCLEESGVSVNETLQFTVGGKTYNIRCPEGKRIFVEREEAETINGIEYQVSAEDFRYLGDNLIIFGEEQREYYLTLIVEPVANLLITNTPDQFSITLQNASDNTAMSFENLSFLENLAVGRYSYEIKADGFEPLFGTIGLVQGDNSLTFTAPSIISTGILNLTVEPPTANVNISSLATGEEHSIQSSEQSLALPLGEYSWSASAEDHESKTGQIVLNSGESYLSINLQPIQIMGELVIAVRPIDADITIRKADSDEVIQPRANELLNLVPGEYEYRIELPGFNTRTGTVEVRPGTATSITATLNEVSIVSFIEEMQQAHNLRDASALIRRMPAQGAGLSVENRLRYHNELYRLSVILYEGGDINDAVNVFEYLVAEDNANFQARLALGNHLVRNANNINELSDAREFLRPMFGSMRFNYPPNERQRVELTARYFYALSYYEQIRLTNDRDRRGVVARQAISQLRDAYARFSDAGTLPQDLQNYKNDTMNLIQVVEADILFGIN